MKYIIREEKNLWKLCSPASYSSRVDIAIWLLLQSSYVCTLGKKRDISFTVLSIRLNRCCSDIPPWPLTSPLTVLMIHYFLWINSAVISHIWKNVNYCYRKCDFEELLSRFRPFCFHTITEECENKTLLWLFTMSKNVNNDQSDSSNHTAAATDVDYNDLILIRAIRCSHICIYFALKVTKACRHQRAPLVSNITLWNVSYWDAILYQMWHSYSTYCLPVRDVAV